MSNTKVLLRGTPPKLTPGNVWFRFSLLRKEKTEETASLNRLSLSSLCRYCRKAASSTQLRLTTPKLRPKSYQVECISSILAPKLPIISWYGLQPCFLHDLRFLKSLPSFTWLPLPAPPDPSPNSQPRTNSQSSVIRAFAPPFANPIFANLPTQVLYSLWALCIRGLCTASLGGYYWLT